MGPPTRLSPSAPRSNSPLVGLGTETRLCPCQGPNASCGGRAETEEEEKQQGLPRGPGQPTAELRGSAEVPGAKPPLETGPAAVSAGEGCPTPSPEAAQAPAPGPWLAPPPFWEPARRGGPATCACDHGALPASTSRPGVCARVEPTCAQRDGHVAHRSGKNQSEQRLAGGRTGHPYSGESRSRLAGRGRPAWTPRGDAQGTSPSSHDTEVLEQYVALTSLRRNSVLSLGRGGGRRGVAHLFVKVLGSACEAAPDRREMGLGSGVLLSCSHVYSCFYPKNTYIFWEEYKCVSVFRSKIQ